MTTISEIAPDVFSICTYIEQADLQFRQFLIRDEQPLLYHTGTRRTFERVRDAVGQVIDPESLRWIAFSHFEADECGALNEWLAAAPEAESISILIRHRPAITA
jgi:flavorubredoxin